jgi:DNA-binding winged helix-turn-helix (wHTH) protein/tetratricopeptide (TPR) repeat protein
MDLKFPSSDMSLKKQGKYRFHDFEIDLAHRSLRREGHVVMISPRTFDLLVFLALNAQRVVTKDELMDALWPDSPVEESNLSQHILLLRKALIGAESDGKLVITIPDRGYQFTAPVSEVLQSDTDPSSRLRPRASDPVKRVSVEAVIEGDESSDTEPSVSGQISGFFSAFRHPGSWQIAILTATLAVVGFGSLLGWRWMHRTIPDSLGLVIADIQNATGDPEFDSTLKTAISIDLQQSPYLQVATGRQIADKLFEMKEMKLPSGQGLSANTARDVCQRLNDQAYLTGEIRRFAQKYLVTLRAFDCKGGSTLAGSKGIADTPDGVLWVMDKVAVDLRKQLGEPGKSVASFSKPLFSERTGSLEALKAYSEASHLELQGKLEDSATLFKRAIELDPQFAIAFADLGSAYSNLGQRDLAAASLTRSYELRDSVDEASRLFIIATYNDVVTGDLQAGIRNYKAWIEAYPRNPVPLSNLADLEIQIGKPALALDPGRHALELNPADALAYIVLARAQMHLGQFEEAARTCNLAISHHLGGEQIHGFLLQIAFLRLDQPGIDEQIAWARNENKAAEPYMLLQQGLMDFAQGKAKSAQATLARLVDDDHKQGMNERANRILGAVPRTEAELGLTETAYALLTRMPAINDSTDIPVAWAHVGETSRATAILKRELDTHPTGTLWQEDFGPQIKAAIALNQHRPEDAIEALKPAVPYDLRSFDVPALRGRAYLVAKQPVLAEAEFHKILDHPGIEPLSQNYPLAQLGLARALAQQGKTVEAGFAYKVVIQIWKDADPDLPRLKEAKAEYAKLMSGESSASLTKPRHQ